MINGRTLDGVVRVVSYREFDQLVRRIAGGLDDFGVRTGDVVAFQLPDWWETAALLLACLRIGAVAQPIVPQLRAREIERALARTGARVCVTVDSWAGFGHARALAEMAPRLPRLRQRVVYGDAADTGALDFHESFVRPTGPGSLLGVAGGPGPAVGGVVHLGQHRRAQGRAAHLQHDLRRHQRVDGDGPGTGCGPGGEHDAGESHRVPGVGGVRRPADRRRRRVPGRRRPRPDARPDGAGGRDPAADLRAHPHRAHGRTARAAPPA